MKTAFNKEILRSITRSFSRFLAILLIVALGTGFYAGLRMTAPDMKLAADVFYDGTHLYDIRITSTLGLTDEDVEALTELPDIEAVMPVCRVDVVTLINGEQYTVRISSIDTDAATKSDTSDGVQAISENINYLNRPLLVEGAWPEKPGECVISADRIMDTPVSIGDTIQLLEGAQELDSVLKEQSYTIVGFVNSPEYTSPASLGTTSLGSGILQQYMYISAEDFADDMVYTDIFLAVKGARDALSASFEYQSIVDAAYKDISGIVSDREKARYSAVIEEAQNELDDASAEYELERADVEAQLDDAKQSLDDAFDTITQNEEKIASGQEAYDSGVIQLANAKQLGQSKLSQSYQDLASKQSSYDANAAALVEVETALNDSWAQWQASKNTLDQGYLYLETLDPSSAEYISLKAALDAQKVELETTKATLDVQQAVYDEKKAALDASAALLSSGWTQYYAGKAQFEDEIAVQENRLANAAVELQTGRDDLESGKLEYADALAEYEEKRAEADEEFADAEAELAKAQQEIDDIEMTIWYVMDRTKNSGAESFQSDAGRVDQISRVFPFLFFLVAALVALTSMTRMVEEERMLIGTYKALGYSKARISSKYLIYALLASGLGSILGIVVLSQILPAVIFGAYAIMYGVPTGPTPIDLGIALLSAGLGIGVTLASTWWAVASTLREKPSALMLPRAPKPGKRILLERITPLWKRVSFSWKVTFRNIFRYKRRFIMTILGIAGCTALLLTGLGLSDAINDIIAKQYGEIYHYNTSIRVDGDISEEDQALVDEVVNDDNLIHAHMSAYETMYKAEGEGRQYTSYVIVPENPEELDIFITLRERAGQKPLELDSKSIIIGEKLASQVDVGVGDSITLHEVDEMGNAVDEGYTFLVGGITENYIGSFIFITPQYYEEVFGEVPIFSTILADSTPDDEGRQEISEALLDIEGVRTVGYNDESIESYQNMLDSVNSIVVVLVVAAAVLAFIVLYNLTNINITERKREIATLKVLGFMPREVDAYIYRETMLLTIIGALLGLILGVFMESYVVTTAEVDAVMFGREIHGASFAIAFVLTIVFSVIVEIAMRRKLSQIDMVESLKSVE